MKKFLTLTALCLFLSTWAYSFESDGLYYSITSSTPPYKVAVTWKTYGGTEEYNGDIIIPSTTTYGGITYTVTSIGSYAFYDDGENDPSFGTTSISLPPTITTIQSNAFNGCRELTSIVIPSSVTNILTSAFQGCTGLTSISIPEGISYVYQSAFKGCTSLSSVSFPSSLTTIQANAFDGCTSLNSITLPSYAHTIQDYAFTGCSNLNTINCLADLPPNITSTTFSNTSARVVVPCSGLSSYKIANGWNRFSNFKVATFVQDGILYQPNALCNEVSVLPNSYSGSVTIPSSVTYNSTTYAVTAIGDSAFYGCTGLTSITIPEGITSIGIRAFYNCNKLTALNLPTTITSIGIWAFYQCTGLKSVVVHEGVTSIKDYTFYCCNELTSLSIPEGVTSIGVSAISNCYKLSSITLPSTVTTIGMYAFFCCPFTSLTIPEGVTSIGLAAFRLCTGLTTVTIPSSLTSIGDNAFSACSGLTSIFAKKATPASITMGAQVFIDVDKSNCTLYVPTGCFSVYDDATQWQDFINIVELPLIWNGSAWSATPNTATDAIINGDYSGAGFSCHDLTVNAGKQMTISSGTMNVTGNLYLKSDASGTASLINNGTLNVTGSTYAERYLTGGTWHVVSPITTGQSISTFIQATDNAIPSKDVSGTTNYGMMDYNEATNAWGSYFTTSTSGNLSLGKGYCLRRTADGVVTFTGNITSGTSSVTLTQSTALPSQGWNCIGNPYTSAINVTSAEGATNFLTENITELDGAYGIYVWNGSSYSTYSNSSNTVFCPGQGFIVRSKEGGGTVTFTPNMQVHSASTALKSTLNKWTELILNVSNGQTSASTVINFNGRMTKGLDPTYDAGLMRGTDNLLVYTRLVADNGIDFAIQCLPEEYDGIIIPVGIDCKNGGDVTFTTSTVDLPVDCTVLLEDKATGIITSLDDNGSYSATIDENSSGTGRFFIHLTNETTAVASVSSFKLNAYYSGVSITINGAVSSQSVAYLSDVTGRMIGCYFLKQGGSNVISTGQLTPGIYLLKVIDGKRQNTSKIVAR